MRDGKLIKRKNKRGNLMRLVIMLTSSTYGGVGMLCLEERFILTVQKYESFIL